MASDEIMNATISQIKNACRYLNKTDASRALAVNLMGPPGMGKTQLFEQLALEWKAEYKVFLTSTMDPTDLVGIPMNMNNTHTAFLPPRDFIALTNDCEKIGVNLKTPMIAIFEDLPACHPQVFNALLRFMQQREVGGRKIRKNVFIGATGNRVEDRAGAASIPTALANRFIHFNLKLDVEEWCNWAMENSIDPTLVSFIERKGPAGLHSFDPTTGFLAFPTPRSVAMASTLINAIGYKDEKALALALSGACGSGWAIEFTTFMRIRDKIVPIAEIFKNPTTAKVPTAKDMDIMFITTNNAISAIINNVNVDHAIAFLTYLLRYDSEECILHGARKVLRLLVSGNSKFSSKDQEKISLSKIWKEVTKMQHLIKSVE